MKLQMLCGILPKKPGFFYHPYFFHPSDENCVSSQFESFQENGFVLNLKIMKIKDRVNFLKLFFLIVRGWGVGTNHQILIWHKCVIDFQWFCVTNFENNKYPQNKVNLNNLILRKCLLR